MLNLNLIGKKYARALFKVTKERIILLSKVIGQTDPIYFNHESTVKLGYRGNVYSPTFIIFVGIEQDYPHNYIEDIDTRICRIWV